MSFLDLGLQDYWNWTWDDLVVHDLPAVVDLVFRTTGQKVHYIGHSMVKFLQNNIKFRALFLKLFCECMLSV